MRSSWSNANDNGKEKVMKKKEEAKNRIDGKLVAFILPVSEFK